MINKNRNSYVKKTLNRIEQNISKTIPRKLLSSLREIKKQHIKSVIEDPICAELKSGANGGSQFIQDGNLFSFFGFKEGDDPVGDLEKYLSRNISFSVGSAYKNFTLSSLVRYPSFSNFEQSSTLALPWGAGSWPVRIEKGLPNLGKFLSIQPKGRSGGGIQVKNELNQQDWTGIPFISKHKRNFIRRVNNIKF